MDRRTSCLLFRCVRPHHFLVLMGTFTILSFILGYAISVSLDKVNYLFPYISDTGTTTPASSYFGLCLNLASVFAAISMYFRHSFLEKQEVLPTVRLHMLNDVTLLIGGFSAFGIMLVANFQETSVLTIHLIGAFMTFALGNVYCWINTYISHVIRNETGTTQGMIALRGILSAISTFTFLLTMIGASMAKNESGKTINLHWTSDQKGYKLHLMSTFSEWIMGISFVIFFLTFVGEFRRMKASLPISFSNHQQRMPFEENVNV